MNLLTQCNSLDEFERFLQVRGDERLRPVTGGLWGGRYLSKGGDRYRLNDIVRKLETLCQNIEPAPSNRIQGLMKKIQNLDLLAETFYQQESERRALLMKVMTAIKRFFGNFFYKRKQVLEEMSKRYPLQYGPATGTSAAGQSRKRVRIVDGARKRIYNPADPSSDINARNSQLVHSNSQKKEPSCKL